jgi:cell division septal protein FtsQ
MKIFKSSTLASPHLRKRRKKVRIIKASCVAALLILVLFGLSELSKQSSVTIRDIETQGNVIATHDDVAAVADAALQGNDLWLFPKRDFLLYSKDKVKQAITNAFPVFNSVNVSLKNPHTLSVSVTERVPKALWCAYDGTQPDPLTNDCYLMDASGYIYLKAPEFKGNAYVKYYGIIANDNPIGQSYLPNMLSQLAAFTDGVRGLGLAPVALYANDGEFTLYLADGGRIIFNSDSNLEDTLANLDTVLQNNLKSSSQKDSPIDYIDLRYGNKVYFKFKQ